MKIRCLLGLHKYKYLGVSEYGYSSGYCELTEVKDKVYQCELCGKLKAPWWWDKSERDLRPYESVLHFGNWKKDVKTLKIKKD